MGLPAFQTPQSLERVVNREVGLAVAGPISFSTPGTCPASVRGRFVDAPARGGTVALMGTYSAQQREILKELQKLQRSRPMAGANGQGGEPSAWNIDGSRRLRAVLKKLYRMTDAEIDKAIEALNDT